MNFLNAWVLFFLPLIAVPFIFFQSSNNNYSWNEMIPSDPLSTIIGVLLKFLSSVIIALLVVLLAEPFSDQKVVERVGEGAQIGLVLDRSASMDDPFSGGGDKAGETKSAAASRLIIDFFEARTNDMVGVITFSNSAMFVLPLTENKEAIKAAVTATAGNALFQTNIGAGLTSSAALFNEVADSGSRAVILLSDGAGRIDANTQQKIRDWFDRFDIGLYWIVLKQEGGISIFDEDYVPRDEDQLPPQIELYEYFSTFRSPFKAYEAEDPKSLETAIKDISLKEKKPIAYSERIPGKSYSLPFLLAALFLSLLLLLLKFIEVKSLR
ncbi:MAG: VWA domain-containing protein [Betaproteobacteria bacterium]|jgi:mxaC protein|uniref:MxaC protein, putative n=1 Tax=Methylophilales bacterium HTCC2181 TaxID=383631 RepID=A0P6C1_9PROT|nr:MxaC protein, putative [Methylophilales bacterium HTCC2181]MCH9781222.1 VWA domain-containing protein [Betaproteobacteria bacterium]MDA9087890.1 VWA domain-containing protein [Methylophilaceae bacterium]MCH9841724.1 VWA domain-containing protein [Betaproteobacteria bacterium]MDC0552656.1 VWA domain-containing protein [Methylophilaceae bacterium]